MRTNKTKRFLIRKERVLKFIICLFQRTKLQNTVSYLSLLLRKKPPAFARGVQPKTFRSINLCVVAGNPLPLQVLGRRRKAKMSGSSMDPELAVEPQSLKKLSFKSVKRALDLFSPIHGHIAPPDPER